MNRDNIVFATCGLLLGLIIGSLVIGPRVARSQLAGAPAAESVSSMPSSSMMAGSDTTGGSTSAAVVTPAASGATGTAGLNPMGMVLQQLTALKTEVAKNPKNADALVQLGNLYMDAAKFQQAAEFYERAIAVRDEPGVRTDLGICYRKLNQPEKALASFQAARTADPSQWQASFNEAIVLADLHRNDEARTIAGALSKSRPGDPDVAKLQAMLAAAK
jgi:Flp pilus assembly protein TadD